MGCRASFSTLQDEFGAPIREVRPYASLDARAPTPTKPAGPTPVLRSRNEQSGRPGSGRRADGAGELTPGPEPREARRQVQHDAAHRALHPDGELDQPLAQRGDLGAQAVPAARRWSSWNRMYAARLSRTRNWLARNREQLVRSISSP